MADFISQLNGTQMDNALTAVARCDPEAWAVGQRNGQNVPSTDETYNNNAKYYAESAYESAARASGSIPSGTAGAVFFDRAQSLTDSQKAQARANIAAANSNRNLLDNPWFLSASVINQRSVSGTLSSTGYFYDRWKANTTGIVIASGYITLPANGGFRQYLELGRIADGKPYTLSVMTDDEAVYTMTGNLTSSASGWQVNKHLLQNYIWAGIRVDSGKWDIDITSTNGVNIKAVKLELGSYSTLINDTPPDYGEELLKCMRYFYRLNMNSNRCYGVGFAESTTSVRMMIPLPVPMRTNPNQSSTPTSGTIRLKGNGSLLTPSAFSTQADAYSGSASLAITVSGATQYAIYALSANDAAYIDFSADL